MFRKQFITLLLDCPMSVTQLARQVRESPKDIEQDWRHFLKSLQHMDYRVEVTAARCRKCGFEFAMEKLRKPSKCPTCNSTWITDPLVCLRRKG